MSDDHEAQFDAVLQRMLTMKPMTAKQLSAKLKAERESHVQNLDKRKKA